MINLLNSQLIESPDYIRLPLIQERVRPALYVMVFVIGASSLRNTLNGLSYHEKKPLLGSHYHWGGLSFNVRTPEIKITSNSSIRWWWSVQEI